MLQCLLSERDTNIAIPDWVRALPGASTDHPGPPTGSSAPRVTQVVPNWNNPNYLAAFEQLLAALGRRYDNDKRLSVFEFSGAPLRYRLVVRGDHLGRDR